MFIIEWIEIPVSYILYFWHLIISPIFGAASGLTWVLSIVGLVVVIRILLIPLFVKQIKAQRGMQLIQPKMKEIQKKYAGDRERQSQEMMKLYKETGTNPLSSCLPILLQAPIFFALFRVLQYGIAQQQPVGALTQELVDQAHNATILGVPLWGTFMRARRRPIPGDAHSHGDHDHPDERHHLHHAATAAREEHGCRQPDGQADEAHGLCLPLHLRHLGCGFPVGVLVYWLTTNLWTMGQQFWVIRNNPVPGTPAHEAFMARKQAKAAAKAQRRAGPGSAPEVIDDQGRPVQPGSADGDAAPSVEPKTPARSQPKRQSKSQRSRRANPAAVSPCCFTSPTTQDDDAMRCTWIPEISQR